MAQSIISKEELLENAYEIAEEGGISALSIRGLATKSGVSVGTVYRFFAAKDELTIATIELYFARAFYKEFCHLDTHTAFVDYCEKMNVSMHQVFNHFRKYWLRGAEALPSAERAAARLRESQQIEHVVNGLVEIYKHDPNIVADLPDGFTPRSVCEFTLDNVLDSLRHQNGDCKVLFGLLKVDALQKRGVDARRRANLKAKIEKAGDVNALFRLLKLVVSIYGYLNLLILITKKNGYNCNNGRR